MTVWGACGRWFESSHPDKKGGFCLLFCFMYGLLLFYQHFTTVDDIQSGFQFIGCGGSLANHSAAHVVDVEGSSCERQ